MTQELHLVYRETRERLIALASRLDVGQLATVTQACPAWTVRDIYAHLTGLAADLAAGGDERYGAPERTAVQVSSRKGRSIHELCEEWAQVGPKVETRIEAEGRAMTAPVVDVWTHEQDLANAAGVQSGRDGSGLMVTLNAVWSWKRKLRNAELGPIRVRTNDVDWVIGDGETPAVEVATSSYEMARAVLGRRSLEQFRDYEWQGDPEPYLPLLPWFPPPPHPIVE